jgi:hypothetical protein
MARVQTKSDPRTHLTGAEIRAQLRAAVQDIECRPVATNAVEESFRKHQSLNRDIPVVLCRRASGKTTGLVHFIAERVLLLPEDDSIAVVCPDENIAMEFSNHYNKHFPTLRYPRIVTPRTIGAFRGEPKLKEIYIEEFFLTPKRELSELLLGVTAGIILGVGTVEYPTTLSVRI